MSKKTYLLDGTRSGFFGSTEDWDRESLYGVKFDDSDFDDDTGFLMVKGRKEALATAKRLFNQFSPCSLYEGDKYRISYRVLIREDRGNGGEMLYCIGGYERVVSG